MISKNFGHNYFQNRGSLSQVYNSLFSWTDKCVFIANVLTFLHFSLHIYGRPCKKYNSKYTKNVVL